MRAGAEVFEQRQHEAREQVAREVVHREAQLVAVAALHPASVARDRAADSGVVDDRIEALVIARHLLRKRAHFVERREVGAQPVKLLVAGARADLVDRGAPSRIVAAVDQQRRALGRELRRERTTEPVGRAGDQNRLLGDGLHAVGLSRNRAMSSEPSASLSSQTARTAAKEARGMFENQVPLRGSRG